MRRPAHRPFALVQTVDQWRRCAHEDTALDVFDGTVELAQIRTERTLPTEFEPLPILAGLAFDAHCRLYRALPEAGQVHRHRWTRPRPLDPVPDDADGSPLFDPEALANPGPLGNFIVPVEPPPPLRQPTGVAVDGFERLYVWEAEAASLMIYELDARRIRERLTTPFLGPVDLAWIRERLVGVGPNVPGILDFGSTPGAGPEPFVVRDFPRPITGVPSRIVGDSNGRAYLLVDAGTADAKVVALFEGADTDDDIEVPGASDIEFLAGSDVGETLVVALGPGHDFRRFVIAAGITEFEPLTARGYDGRGIVRTPDDRILYFGSRGLRHAVAARIRYARVGRVACFRLDADEYQTRWGRLFIDACVPRGTEVRVHSVTADDPPDDAIPHTKPANDDTDPPHPDLTPPLPPGSYVPDAITFRLHPRANGRELPWVVQDPDAPQRFETWDAPVSADPGRYLWVFIELRGDGRRTPRIRSLRAETRGHEQLGRLPRVFSREPLEADFLWRFLAPFDGALGDFELRNIVRHAILHPEATPEAFLPWLASFIGLTLDARWPLDARREAVAQAMQLFRFRGTVPGLRQWLELYLRVPVQIIEHFRVRGLGGAIVGDGGAGSTTSSSVVGAGYRVGGAIGSVELVDLESGVSLAELGSDGFETHAHRFTVVVPASLDSEQREVVELILDEHRPAHTLYELCTLDAGLRIGMGFHLELNSVVGVGAGFQQLQVGGTALGLDALLGQARSGTKAGAARLGKDTRVG